MLTITEAGLAAITSAADGGFKISVTSFKVSEYDVADFTNTNFIAATDLFGVAVFSAPVTLTETIGTSAVKFTLVVPREVPINQTWMFREIGLYLATGELFAIGALTPAYEKNSSYGIKIYVMCAASRLGEVLTVSTDQNNSLPTLSQIRTLPAPIKAEQNALVVLDQITSPYLDEYVAGIAVRSGPGLLHWSFIGHNRVYHGHYDTLVTLSAFKISSATGGFWLNDGEVVICQVTTGSGSGQSRRMRYTAQTELFRVLDTQFEDLNDTSFIAVWRDNANQLPTRHKYLSESLVLGHGLDSWERVSAAPTVFYTYTAQTCSSVLNSSSQFGNQLLEPPNADLTTFVWCDGKLMAESSYSMSWGVVTVYGLPDNTKIDVLLLRRVVSTTGVGGVLNAFESDHVGDGQTKRFYFSIVPSSNSWVSLYIDGVYKHQSEYDYSTTSLTVHEAPAEGAEVLIIQLGLYDDTLGTTLVSRTFRQVQPGENTITFAEPISSKAQLLVYIDGKQYTHQKFQLLSTGGIQLVSPPSYPGGSSFVDMLLFVPTVALTPTTDTQVTGTNSGPRWIDPAGLEGPPNKLVPKVTSLISDGAQLIIPVHSVPGNDYVLVFAGSRLLLTTQYTYDAGRVILNTAIPSGSLIDVVCFTEVTIDDGFIVECTTFSLTSTSDTVYQLAPVSDFDSVIVTANGNYQHKMSYTIDPTSRIYFQGMVTDQLIEVWYFNVVRSTGMRTTMRRDLSVGATSNLYQLSQPVSRKQNVLTFVGGAKYDNNQYELNASADRVALNPNAAVNAPVVAVSFLSAAPKTRLLTRAEYNQSVVSFNFRNGSVILTREDVIAVLQREDILALLTPAERAVLAGAVAPPTEVPHAQPGNTFARQNWQVPADVYSITVVIIGGGGGGGGGSNDLSHAGHGGKRGQVLIRTLDVVPGQLIEVQLGTGGSPYLYTIDGTIIYPQPGDDGTTNGSIGFKGRNGNDTLFHQWFAYGGLGGGSEPAYGPTYVHADAAGEGQVPITGTGTLQGGGAAGQQGIETAGNDRLVFSYPGTGGAFGYEVLNATGGGHSATTPGAGGGGASADPFGNGAFGGAGQNGIVYITW